MQNLMKKLWQCFETRFQSTQLLIFHICDYQKLLSLETHLRSLNKLPQSFKHNKSRLNQLTHDQTWKQFDVDFANSEQGLALYLAHMIKARIDLIALDDHYMASKCTGQN